MKDNGLSLASVFEIRSQAFAKINDLTAAIELIGTAIVETDAALQTAIAERTIDDQQALITAARHLAQIINEVSA